MARGNCRSMNSEIAGKMRSAVSGLDDTIAAVVNELKATSSGMPDHRAILNDCTTCDIRSKIAKNLAHR